MGFRPAFPAFQGSAALPCRRTCFLLPNHPFWCGTGALPIRAGRFFPFTRFPNPNSRKDHRKIQIVFHPTAPLPPCSYSDFSTRPAGLKHPNPTFGYWCFHRKFIEFFNLLLAKPFIFKTLKKHALFNAWPFQRICFPSDRIERFCCIPQTRTVESCLCIPRFLSIW
jgi:hypothetical protein